jgi:enoyl-[acyl-carrier protein] reductase I
MLCASLIFAGSAAGAFVGSPSRMQQSRVGYDAAASSARVAAAPEMKLMDLTGKTAFVAGVADSSGYGWAICKALAEAGATITVGTWPPVLGIFEKSLSAGTPLALFFYVYISSPFRSLRLPAFSREAVPRCSGGGAAVGLGLRPLRVAGAHGCRDGSGERSSSAPYICCARARAAAIVAAVMLRATLSPWRCALTRPACPRPACLRAPAGKFDEDMILSDGSKMSIAKVYPLDAVFDYPEDVPEETKNNKRYAGLDGFTISEVAESVGKDYGKIDILVHSLANGPEVTKPLMETSRRGYLAASSASAYSFVSCVQKFGPVMNEGGSIISLSYIASEKVIPGYGGGMSSAKSQLESDTRVLAYEAGQKYGLRVNTISAGPLKSRAATAINKSGAKPFIEVAIDYCKANAPLAKDLTSDDIGNAAAFLASPMSGAITGMTVYVDNGMHSMGMVQEVSIEACRTD